MRPITLRSMSVRYAKSPRTTLTMIPALMIEIHHGSTTPSPPRVPRRSPACSRAMRATPARRSLAIFARSCTDVPLCDTVTVAPFAIPRAFASAAASSTSACGRWNWSSSTRSTAGPEKSGL